MKITRRIWWGLTILVMTAFSLVMGAALRSATPEPQTSNHGLMPILKKSAAISQTAQMATLVVQLNGFEAPDLLNIRPGEPGQIVVMAGALQGRGRASAPCPACLLAERFKPAHPLAASALQVNADTVTFNRPPSANDLVFLDVQVPPESQVQVMVNSESVLKSSISQPLAYRDQKWVEGKINAAGTMLMATSPGNTTNPAQQPVFDHTTGNYAVASSRLRVLESPSVGTISGKAVAVILHIDESGRVTKVVPLTGNPSPQLEEALKNWRFEPFTIDGKPVRVSTLIHIK